MGDRSGDLHLPAGGPAQQPRHRRADGPGAEKRRLGASGAAPYTDSSPHGQIDRVFAIAREFDIDIDMHLDFAPTPDDLDLLYVCELAERFKWGGRVAIGHVTKLSTAPPDLLEKCAKRMADAGVALTVLPSTDLYLMGRHMTHSVLRGVTEAHKLLHHGVNCTLSTNNVLNPFTPFGDCSLVRMANIYANINPSRLRPRHTRVLQHDHHPVGQADEPRRLWLAGRQARRPCRARCRKSGAGRGRARPVLYAFKRGRRTVTRAPAVLHRPGRAQ